MIVEINAVRCKTCKDIIYSRAPHDCMKCSCGSSFVDGGSTIIGDMDAFGYIRVKGDPTPTTVKFTEFESIQECKKALWDDWNNFGENKYGRVNNC